MMPRPYIIVNCAMSVDGKLALSTRTQTPLSGREDLARVHSLRAKCDGILVGINTVFSDNPSLLVKPELARGKIKFSKGKFYQPTRIVLDSKCRVPRNAKVLNDSAPTLIVVTKGYRRELPNCEMLECGAGMVDLRKLMPLLYKKKIKRLMVEGGGTVIGAFLRARLVDELNIYVGSLIIGGSPAPALAEGWSARTMEETVPLKLARTRKLGNGVLLTYRLGKGRPT